MTEAEIILDKALGKTFPGFELLTAQERQAVILDFESLIVGEMNDSVYDKDTVRKAANLYRTRVGRDSIRSYARVMARQAEKESANKSGWRPEDTQAFLREVGRAY